MTEPPESDRRDEVVIQRRLHSFRKQRGLGEHISQAHEDLRHEEVQDQDRREQQVMLRDPAAPSLEDGQVIPERRHEEGNHYEDAEEAAEQAERLLLLLEGAQRIRFCLVYFVAGANQGPPFLHLDDDRISLSQRGLFADAGLILAENDIRAHPDFEEADQLLLLFAPYSGEFEFILAESVTRLHEAADSRPVGKLLVATRSPRSGERCRDRRTAAGGSDLL